MKAAYIVKHPLQGSRYKHGVMFSRVCEVDHVDAIPRDNDYRFAIVRGDHSKDFEKAQRAGLPYLLIQHDVWSVRAGLPRCDDEERMMRGASAILYTSEHHHDLSERYSDLPYSEVVHLRPFRKDLDFTPLPKLPGRNIVYAGGIVGKDGSDMFGYRKYHRIFAELMKCGWTVHLYPAWGAVERGVEYAEMGCIVHDPVSQSDLYRELSQYQVGFQGYARVGPQAYIRSCRPNKLWEYLAAGIPTFGYNTGTGSHLYEGRWGYVAKSLKAFPETLEKVAAMSIPLELRYEQTIDGDEDAFRRLVEHVDMFAPQPPEHTYTLSRKVHPFTFMGRHWNPGDSITHSQALAMKDAGHIAGNGLRA